MTAVRSLPLPASAAPPPISLEGALVRRARTGDAAAFRAIFERHAPPVRRFLRDLLGDDAAADEATQETFVRAHSRLGSIRDTDKLASWLFGIARFVFLEQLRARKSLGAPSRDPDSEADQVDDSPTPEVALLGREADHLLDEALAGLSDQRRSALLLRIDHGLGYEDIAEIMGWPIAKVKNEIHRARLQLRSHLTKYIGGTP